jgi:ankyrin repeat protein
LPVEHPLWLEFAKTADSGYFKNPRTSPALSLLDSVLPSRENGILPLAKIHDLLRRFVANGYDLNDADVPGKSGRILNTCCSYGKKVYDQYGSTVPLLLELGADPNLYPQGEPCNLKVALRDGQRDEVVDALLDHPEFDPNMTDDGGQTALHALIESSSDSKIISFLGRNYLSINAQDRQGRTALHLAISRAREGVIRPLLNYPNIKVHLVDINGRTPLALATWWGLSRIASMLIQRSETNAQVRNDSVRAILSAARHGQEDLVAALLPKTGYQNVNRDVDESGKSFLHHAAENNWEAIVSKYLEASDDVNINQIDNAGRTALHAAAHLGCTETARVLLRYGSRVNIQDRLGMNPPQLAAEAGFKDTLMVLLGLDDNQTYRPGEVNSSRWAAQVDANQRDHLGRNLVHWAATLDCLDVMQVVCREPGIELARKDNAGKIPIDYAWDCQCPQVGRYLAMRMRCAPLSASISSWADIYDWDGAYSVAAKKQRNIQDPDLLELVLAREEREKAREMKKYDTAMWALVSVDKYSSESEHRNETRPPPTRPPPTRPSPTATPQYEPSGSRYNTSSGSGRFDTSQPPPSTYSPFAPQPEQAGSQWQPPHSSPPPPPPPPRPQSSYYDPGPQPTYDPGHHQGQGTYHHQQPGYSPNYYPGQAAYSEPQPGYASNYYPGQEPHSEPQPGFAPDYGTGHAPYPGTQTYGGTQSYPGFVPSGYDSQPYPPSHPQPAQQYERDFTSNPYPSEASRPPNRLRRRKQDPRRGGKQS